MRILPKRRRLEKRTNYTKRKNLLEHSKSRIVIRKTNKYVILQYVESKEAQDKIRLTTVSNELLNYGWSKDKIGSLKNLGAAYLAGFLFGNKIKANKELRGKVILDTGLIRSTPGSRVYAAAKGIIDAGIELPCNEKVFPSEDRIKNENVKAFFDKIKENIKGGKKSN